MDNIELISLEEIDFIPIDKTGCEVVNAIAMEWSYDMQKKAYQKSYNSITEDIFNLYHPNKEYKKLWDIVKPRLYKNGKPLGKLIVGTKT